MVCCWFHCCHTLVQIPSSRAFWSGNSKSSRSSGSGLSSSSASRVVGAGRLWCCPRHPESWQEMHRSKYCQCMYMMPICLVYTWHMAWRKVPCEHNMSSTIYMNDIYQIHDFQECHISDIYQIYQWYKHGLWRHKSFTRYIPTQNFQRHCGHGTSHVPVWLWYIP